MKNFFLTIVWMFVSLTVLGQNMQQIQGGVFDDDGTPLPGATITSSDSKYTFKTGEDGRFTISIPHSVKFLTASKEGYFSKKMEIDGAFVIFKLKEDKNYYAKKEEQARFAIEMEQMLKQEEENKKKAEAEAKVKAEQEAFKAAERARKAEQASAQKNIRKQKDSEYGSVFKNKGFVNSLEFSYNYQLPITTEGSSVNFENYGKRDYGDLKPVELDYLLGYRFSRLFSLNIGVGFLYYLDDLRDYGEGDIFDPIYEHKEYHTFDIPLFLNARVYLTRAKVQPMLSLSGGLYVMTQTFLLDGGIGCSFRFGRLFNMYVLASIKTTPWPSYMGIHSFGYEAAWSCGVKLGFML